MKKLFISLFIIFLLINTSCEPPVGNSILSNEGEDSPVEQPETQTDDSPTELPEPQEEDPDPITDEEIFELEPYEESFEYEIINTGRSEDWKLGTAYNRDFSEYDENGEVVYSFSPLDINAITYTDEDIGSYNESPSYSSNILSDVVSSDQLLDGFKINRGKYQMQLPLGQKTVKYISNLKFGENSITSFKLNSGVASERVKSVWGYEYTEEAKKLNEKDPQAFKEKFGNCFVSSVREGYLIFELETFIFDPNIEKSSEELKGMVRGYQRAENDDKILKLSELMQSGIKRFVYTYSTFNNLPETDKISMTNLLDGVQDKENDMYSVLFINLRDYYWRTIY
ncbi:MAG: hypothetical protein GY756_21080 [bacterium]|nr:hypothetical protein [bacterium]